MEAISRRRCREDADLVLSADQMSADDVERRFEFAEFVVGGNHEGPYLAVERGDRCGVHDETAFEGPLDKGLTFRK